MVMIYLMKDQYGGTQASPILALMTRRHQCLSILAAALAACAPAPPRDNPPGADTGSVTVTDTRTFGRILGETAQAARKVHLQVLTQAGTDFESWVAYTLLTENEPAMPKEALIADLARRLELEQATTTQLLDRLASAGHVRTRVDGATERIELTPDGTVYLRRVREAVSEASHRLVGHVEKHDLDTTVSVLRAVGEAASDLMATIPRSPLR